MSHDQDAGGRPNRPGSRTGAAARLDRPSLFAEFDQNQIEDIEPERVRLLSTLESQRGRARRPVLSTRQRIAARRAWGTRLLLAFMAVGIVLVFISFVQVLRRPAQATPAHDAVAQGPAALAVPASAATVAVAALPSVAPSVVPSAPDDAAALIETDPTSTGPRATEPGAAVGAALTDAPSLASALPHTATTAATPTSRGATATATASSSPAPAPPVATMLAKAADDVARLNTRAPTRSPASDIATGTSRPRDSRPRAQDDVALLEALLAHASTKRAPPSAAEGLATCARLQGAEAAVCRARVCVQHPTATQCHSDAP